MYRVLAWCLGKSGRRSDPSQNWSWRWLLAVVWVLSKSNKRS